MASEIIGFGNETYKELRTMADERHTSIAIVVNSIVLDFLTRRRAHP